MKTVRRLAVGALLLVVFVILASCKAKPDATPDASLGPAASAPTARTDAERAAGTTPPGGAPLKGADAVIAKLRPKLKVVDCISDSVKRAQFAAPGGLGSVLNVPVTFVAAEKR